MENQLTLAPEKFGIEQSRAEAIKAIFLPMSETIKAFEDRFNEVNAEAGKEITKEVVAKAKSLRLDIAKVRIRTEKARKEAKEESLRQGKAIDGTANVLKYAIQDKENKLREIENYFENLEAERIKNLQIERVLILNEFEVDGELMALGAMTEDVWENYLTGVKTQFEARKKAERKAEEERIAAEKARIEEEKRIREENERLKAEAKIAETKRLKEEKARLAEQEKARQEEEKRKKAQQLEIQKAQAEAKKIADEKARVDALLAKKEAEEKARIAAEKEKEAEEKRIAAEKEKAKKLAPDKEKLEAFAKSLSAIEMPELSNAEAKKILEDVKMLMQKIQGHIRTKSKNL